MTLVGNIGQCAIVPEKLKGWNAARAVGVIRLQNSEDTNFVHLALQSEPVQYLMQAWANTTVQPTLNLKEVRQLPVVFPPVEIRRAFTRLVAPIYDQVDRNQREMATLSALRDALLPELLSGELTTVELGRSN